MHLYIYVYIYHIHNVEQIIPINKALFNGCIYIYICVYIYIYVYILYTCTYVYRFLLEFVWIAESVSPHGVATNSRLLEAKEPYKRDYIPQKRPIMDRGKCFLLKGWLRIVGSLKQKRSIKEAIFRKRDL